MRRTPRNFNGTSRTEKTLVSLLPEILKSLRTLSETPTEEIFRCWFSLIGPKMAPFTEPVSYVDGVLTVKVKSSTLYSLLSRHEKPRLLKELGRQFSVRNLIVRIG